MAAFWFIDRPGGMELDADNEKLGPTPGPWVRYAKDYTAYLKLFQREDCMEVLRFLKLHEILFIIASSLSLVLESCLSPLTSNSPP